MNLDDAQTPSLGGTFKKSWRPALPLQPCLRPSFLLCDTFCCLLICMALLCTQVVASCLRPPAGTKRLSVIALMALPSFPFFGFLLATFTHCSQTFSPV